MKREMIEDVVMSSIIDLVYDYFAYDTSLSKLEALEEANKVIDTICKRVATRLLAAEEHYITVVIEDNHIWEVYYDDDLDDVGKRFEAMEDTIVQSNVRDHTSKNLMVISSKEEVEVDGKIVPGWNTMWELGE